MAHRRSSSSSRIKSKTTVEKDRQQELEDFLLLLPHDTKPDQVRTLAVANRQLSSLPSKLSFLKSIKRMDLSKNGLTDASPLASLTTLAHLDISNNQLANLDFAESLTSLVVLNVSHNKLKSFSRGLSGSGARSLKALIAGHNAISLVKNEQSGQVFNPESLSSCTALETLVLSRNALFGPNNKLADIEDEFWDMLSTSGKNLRKLSLSECGLTRIGATTDLPMLNELRISHNTVEIFPLSVKIPSLKILDVSSNALANVESTARFRFLNQLNIRGNPVTSGFDHPLQSEPIKLFLESSFELLSSVDGKPFEALDADARRTLRRKRQRIEESKNAAPSNVGDNEDGDDDSQLRRVSHLDDENPTSRKKKETSKKNKVGGGLSKDQIEEEINTMDKVVEITAAAPKNYVKNVKVTMQQKQSNSNNLRATGASVWSALSAPNQAEAW